MILVAGATGMLGGLITRGLLGQGRAVRILVRPPSAYQDLVIAGAEPVFGDLKNRSSLDTACEGADVVVTTATAAQRAEPDTIDTVDREGNRNLIEAAHAAGVRQFVFVSANIAAPDSPVPLMAAKALTEDRLVRSGMPWTILAPDAFMEVWISMLVGAPAMAGHEVVFVGSGERKHSFVSAGDVAAFAVASVDHPAALNHRLVIGGPEALSIRDAARIFGRVLGHPVPERGVAPGVPIEGIPEAAAGLLAGLDFYDSPVDMTELASTFGVRLTSLEEYAGRMVPVHA